MDLVNEQKLADAFAPVIKNTVDELVAKLPEALKDALDGMTITISIAKKTSA